MKKIIFILSVLFSANVSAVTGWQSFMAITDNYWGSVTGGRNIVLVMDADFHTCGWNAAADIREAVVGPELFDTLTSVSLSSIMAGKKISVWVDGCVDDRAKVMSIRIQN